MMELDTQSVLIGALLIEDKLAPYALPELSMCSIGSPGRKGTGPRPHSGMGCIPCGTR